MVYCKFFICDTEEALQSKVESGAVGQSDIVFVKGSKQIWTHGTTYNCPYSADEISNIITKSEGNTTELINQLKKVATTTSDGLMSSEDKLKLDQLVSSAGEPNQNAFSKVAVGNATILADQEMDTLSLVAGDNITITPDTTNDSITITAKDTTYNEATESAAGLMSASDKAKLDKIDDEANNYILPLSNSNDRGGIKVGYSANGANIPVALSSEKAYVQVTSTSISSALGYTPATPDLATTTTEGLMSSTDKTKLDGIAEGANNYSLPNATASVKGGVKIGNNITVSSGTISISKDNVVNALNYEPADKSVASANADGLMSTDMFNKLKGIESGAQVNTITGIKGNSESTYRTGNVNITKANIGLGNVDNESKSAMFTSPEFTGTPTAPTATAGTNSTQLATTAFVQTEIANKIAAADAMIYKGTVSADSELPYTSAKTGWTYKVATKGTYANQACEVGDMIICLTDASGNTNATWTVVQNNIDGAVTGPSSATDGAIALFDKTTGKVIKNSNVVLPTDPKFTDTTYSAGNGIVLSESKFSHADTSTLSGAYGPSEDVVGNDGATIVIPQVTVDTYGHVTGVTNRTYTSKDTTYIAVTPDGTTPGLMSVADKIKLDGIAEGANKYSLPTASASTKGGVTIGDNISVSSGKISLTSGNVTSALGFTPANVATMASANGAGLMTSDMFNKLDGIAEGADSVSFTKSLTSGTKVGTITINGTGTDIYCQTNTTYTFASGNDGNFTVTPSNGSAQTVNIGKPATAGTADSATVAGKVSKQLVLKFKSGVSEGTDLYTYDGSNAKSLNIKQGSNITLNTSTAGEVTISATDTKYSGGTGITLSGTSFNLTDGVLSTGTVDTQYGPSQDVTGNEGSTIKIPFLKVDTYGRVTTVGHYTLTNKDTKYSLPKVGTAGTYGPSQDVTGTNTTTISIPQITTDEYGRVTSVATRTYTSKDTTYSVASDKANGLMSTADKTKLDAIGGIINKSKTLTVGTSWSDTGLLTTDLDGTGTYVVQVYLNNSSTNGAYQGYWSGIMSAYAGNSTETTEDEIVLHCNSSSNGAQIYLRTKRQSSAATKLQISSNVSIASSTYVFKFRKLI